MDPGYLVVRRIIGPLVGRAIPALRTARARLARGRGFAVPAGRTYILLPEALDYECAAAITEMLDRLWYQRGRDWEVVRLGPGTSLGDDIRRANLIVLGGPDQNPVTRELLREHPELFPSVSYRSGSVPEFRWRDHVHRADECTDFGLVVLHSNVLTSEPRRRLVLLFGLGETGTLGAARLFADERYARERRELQREHGTIAGNLEALLHVAHAPGGGEIHRVRAATRGDGLPLELAAAPAPDAGPPLSVVRASLARIYDSLQQHRRSVVLSDLRFTLTVTRDYALRIDEEVTIGAERQDVVVFTKAMRGTPLDPDEDIEFDTGVVEGDDDQVSLPVEVLQSERRFLLFPLPPMVGGGPSRRIRISAVWPRACRTLQRPGGEDLSSVAVSEQAGPNVDTVTVIIRFDVHDAAFQVFERFPLENAIPDDGGRLPRRRTYDIHSPYRLRLADVPRGTMLEFRIVRVETPASAA